jgi:preprotein translocase subunit Sss1
MANDLVSSMNYHAKQHAIVEAKNSISFLEKELEQTSILNSQTMLYSIIEQQVQKIMLANIRDEFVFKVIDAAVNPTKPEPSKMILITLLGGFLGGFISIFLAIFHNYIKREVRYK